MSEAAAPALPPIHPLRAVLHGEIHARPIEPVRAPGRISHLAVLSDEHSAEVDRRHLDRLCALEGVAPPSEGSKHFRADFGRYRLVWERHTEFTSYFFYSDDAEGAPPARPFAETPVAKAPADWLEAIPGTLLAASHLVLVPASAMEWDAARIAESFNPKEVVASRVSGGAAEIWTDLRIHGDGFSRLLVRDHSLDENQAGRLVQRLLEIETYRMMALLALPLAREAAPRIAVLDRALASITTRMSSPADDGRESDDQELLDELTRLASESEDIAARSAYRFSAGEAYYTLVRKRLAALREERLERYQTLHDFLDRRLAPAMDTCTSIARRQEGLSARIMRAGNLLRTRVDIALERQNRSLLESMDRRAKLQLRLQQTVEGLSVAAVSYYLVGLLGYALKAAKAAAVPVDVPLVQGLAIPPTALLIWLVVRRIRRKVTGDGAKKAT